MRKYEQVQARGADRRFPVHVLLGAEAVLARMIREHTISKQYTPLQLQDIPRTRSSQPVSIDDSETTSNDQNVTAGSDFTLTSADRQPWSPASLTAATDGLMAARWAFRFLELGSEQIIEAWITHFERLTMLTIHTPAQLTTLWMIASWKLCIDMRGGRPFDASATSLLHDSAWWKVQLLSAAQRPQIEQQYIPQGPGQGIKRPPSLSSSGPPPTLKLSRSERFRTTKVELGLAKPRPEQDKCKKFNLGTCRRTSCQYVHSCRKCGKPGHGTSTCWWNQDASAKETVGNKAKDKGKDKQVNLPEHRGDLSRASPQLGKQPLPNSTMTERSATTYHPPQTTRRPSQSSCTAERPSWPHAANETHWALSQQGQASNGVSNTLHQ